MNRTYNFQVDNGLFVMEYYLDKKYEGITTVDLKNNVDMLADRINMYKENSNIVSMTHHNSYLTQKGKDIRDQLNILIDNIGSDKNCTICGKKQVNIYLDIAYTALIYGVASPNKFLNRGNNLRSVDICPICMFLSIISFLNTQKMGLATLYNSDSDEFMRDITSNVQQDINKNIMLDIDSKNTDKQFVETMNKLNLDKYSYNDLNYIELIKYNNNPQSPYKKYLSLSASNLKLINRIRHEGLIEEFYSKYLFDAMGKGQNLVKRLGKFKDYSEELYEILKEVYMTKKEIELIDSMTERLIEIDGIKALTDLKLVKDKKDFKRFLVTYSEKINLCNSLNDYNEVIEKYYDYKDYLILNLNLKLKGDI